MMPCTRCRAPIARGSKFCGECGAAVVVEPGATTETSVPLVATPAGSRSPREASTPSGLVEGRFAPGEMVAARYRIAGLLGRGGMGEVYRADDLKLGQPVALKFLPEGLESSAERLGRFLNEVRLARLVGHPNVCRVYDVGEIEGRHFLSMEYVDGEDLASLLRRIGRPEREKALEIARQITAGLGAAHAKGILHRDLKPANVMIDGRGQVRLTDFGLAALADSVGGAEVRAGTPDYMSPEQLSGADVSVRSDLYALGLVFFELFTGKPAFRAESRVDLLRQRESGTPPSPASVIPDLDPAIERVILRCLDRDPARRPPSAIAVAAALPGGDPLAAALAAGETPSPEMVADARAEGALHPGLGAVCLGLSAIGLVAVLALADRVLLTGYVELPRPPGELAVHASDLLRRLGHAGPVADTASGFVVDSDALGHIEDHDVSPARWDGLGRLRPSAVEFWYRESPWPLVPLGWEGTTSPSNPPLARSGMTSLRLDPRGRLHELLVVPPQVDESTATAGGPDWSALFEAAGLDRARFEPAAPTWNPLVTTDARAAWAGTVEAQEGTPLRVEAGAYRGRPVFFKVVAPWTRAAQMNPRERSAEGRAVTVVLLSLLGVILAGGILMARRNLALGRTDRRGAFRMALYLFVVYLVGWALRTHHVGGLDEIGQWLLGVQRGLFLAGVVWTLYLALEPYVRRFWPEALISWSRLLAGRVGDPLVGRDVLFGLLGGIGLSLLAAIMQLLPGRLGYGAPTPMVSQLGLQPDWRGALIELFALQPGSLLSPIALLFLILMLRVLLRSHWAALGGALALGVGLAVLGNPELPVIWPLVAVYWALLILVLVRLGLLASIITVFLSNFLWDLPLTLDRSAWYAGPAWAGLALVLVVGVLGFWRSLAGRRLFEDPLST